MIIEIEATPEQLLLSDELRGYVLPQTIAMREKPKVLSQSLRKTPTVDILADLKLSPLLHKKDLFHSFPQESRNGPTLSLRPAEAQIIRASVVGGFRGD